MKTNHAFSCSAGFQPAVSRVSNPPPARVGEVCRLEIGDTAGWKPALRLRVRGAVLALLATVSVAVAQDAPKLVPIHQPKEDPNRFTAGALFLFNAKIGYSALLSGAPGVNPGAATRGGLHTYDDGFVGVDSTGNNAPPGATSFWGYNTAGQHVDSASDPFVGNDSIALSATTVDATSSYAPGETLDPRIGFELGYARTLGHNDRSRWGAEALLGFLNLDASSGAPGALGVTSLTDLYSLRVNGILVTPPAAPYTGPEVAQPGSPLLDDTPQRQPVTTAAGTVTGNRDFDATVYTLRLGGFYDYAVTTNFNVGLNAGLAVVFVDGEFSFNETVAFTGTGGPTTLAQAGSSSEFNTLFGGYVGVRANYDFNEHWRVFGTANYLGTSSAEQDAGGARRVTVDFNGSFLVTLGLGYAF